MYLGRGGPAEPEEGDYEEGPAEECKRKAAIFFGGCPSAVVVLGTEEDMVVIEVNDARYDSPNANCVV